MKYTTILSAVVAIVLLTGCNDKPDSKSGQDEHERTSAKMNKGKNIVKKAKKVSSKLQCNRLRPLVWK